ncbi:MAG: hypothetical protein WCJ97_12230 [Phycisphaerae bacterium]
MIIPALNLSKLLSVVVAALAVGIILVPQACTKSGEVSEPQNLSSPEKNHASTTQQATWQVIASNELASVQVCQQLYERGPQTPFFVRFRVTNRSAQTIGVDLRDYNHVIYPNQWGDLPTPQRGEIDERRMQFTALTQAEQTKLVGEFKAGALTRLQPGQHMEYYREFNNSTAGRPKGAGYTFVSIDGALALADATHAVKLSCATDGAGKPVAGAVATDMILPSGLRWAQIPAGALILSQTYDADSAVLVKLALQQLTADLTFLEPGVSASDTKPELKLVCRVLTDDKNRIHGASVRIEYNLTPESMTGPAVPIVADAPAMRVYVTVYRDQGQLQQAVFVPAPQTFVFTGPSTHAAYTFPDPKWLCAVTVVGNRPEFIAQTHTALAATLNKLRLVLVPPVPTTQPGK